LAESEENDAIKALKFSDAQKACVLRKAEDGLPIAEMCHRAGIRQATFLTLNFNYQGIFRIYANKSNFAFLVLSIQKRAIQ